jgi:hypothetical protein
MLCWMRRSSIGGAGREQRHRLPERDDPELSTGLLGLAGWRKARA